MSNKEITKAEELPKHLQNMGEGRGSEEVTHDDMVVPRIEQAQGLSPVLKKKDAAYIDGIELGHLYNNVTRESYGDGFDFIPVVFKKEWLIWKDQDEGGGFFGAYSTEAEANAELDMIGASGDENVDLLEIVDTAQHFGLIQHSDGRIEEVVFSMSKSKMKASRQLNSLCRINGGDRFSRVYRVSNLDDTNKKGQEFQSITIDNVGYVGEEAYIHAEKLYNQVKAGTVTADNAVDEVDPNAETEVMDKAF